MLANEKLKTASLVIVPLSIVIGLIIWGLLKNHTEASKYLNTIGLGMDFIGALLIALPLINPLKPGEKQTQLTMPTSEHARLKEKKQSPLMMFGLLLLLVGFIVQLFSNWV